MGSAASKQTEYVPESLPSSSTSTTTDHSPNLQLTEEERMRLEQIENVPKYNRPETFDEKLYRKVRLPNLPKICFETTLC